MLLLLYLISLLPAASLSVQSHTTETNHFNRTNSTVYYPPTQINNNTNFNSTHNNTQLVHSTTKKSITDSGLTTEQGGSFWSELKVLLGINSPSIIPTDGVDATTIIENTVTKITYLSVTNITNLTATNVTNLTVANITNLTATDITYITVTNTANLDIKRNFFQERGCQKRGGNCEIQMLSELMKANTPCGFIHENYFTAYNNYLRILKNANVTDGADLRYLPDTVQKELMKMTSLDSLPWFASIEYRKKKVCAGVFLSENLVVVGPDCLITQINYNKSDDYKILRPDDVYLDDVDIMPVRIGNNHTAPDFTVFATSADSTNRELKMTAACVDKRKADVQPTDLCIVVAWIQNSNSYFQVEIEANLDMTVPADSKYITFRKDSITRGIVNTMLMCVENKLMYLRGLGTPPLLKDNQTIFRFLKIENYL